MPLRAYFKPSYANQSLPVEKCNRALFSSQRWLIISAQGQSETRDRRVVCCIWAHKNLRDTYIASGT